MQLRQTPTPKKPTKQQSRQAGSTLRACSRVRGRLVGACHAREVDWRGHHSGPSLQQCVGSRSVKARCEHGQEGKRGEQHQV